MCSFEAQAPAQPREEKPMRKSLITDNWHLEDNLTFLQQMGLVAR